MEQRNLHPVISPPHLSPLPTRPPGSGGYGRLDSPWRVRSHLKTLGQPKAGTVTITQPLSQREYKVKNSHKVGRNRRGLWAEAGGTWIILSDDQNHERPLFQKGRSLRPRTSIWSSVNIVESWAKVPFLHLLKGSPPRFYRLWPKRNVLQGSRDHKL